jgi:hypothetical protein
VCDTLPSPSSPENKKNKINGEQKKISNANKEYL